MFTVPNRMHFIWFGSQLSQSHQSRLLHWKTLNPSYAIHLWVSREMIDDKNLSSTSIFCQTHDIILHDVNELDRMIDVEVRLWINYCLSYSPRNYGALSDIYRFYVLNYLGGWYFDTDIIPKLPLPEQVKLTYGFAVNSGVQNNTMTFFVPNILVSVKNSVFLFQAIKVIENIASNHVSPFTEFMHSDDALERMLTTNLITGVIALAACSKLTCWYFVSLIHVYNDYSGCIPNTNQF